MTVFYAVITLVLDEVSITGAALDEWVYYLAGLIGLVLCAWRAATVHADRLSWGLVALGLVVLFAGNTLAVALYGYGAVPLASLTDVIWLAVYLPLIAALAVRVHAAGGVRGVVILDVLIAVGALSSVVDAFVIEPVLDGGAVAGTGLVITLAYVVADLVLMSLLVQLTAANGWRLGHAGALMAGCFVFWALTDMTRAIEAVQGSAAFSEITGVGLAGSYVLLGAAAWMRVDPPSGAQSPGVAALVAPAGFAVIALVMVVQATATDVVLAVALAAAAIVGVIARFVLTFHSYLAVLHQTEREATTDALTGLGNRRALTADLEAAVAAGEEAQLLLFDLNGFKRYNDAFGHPAGDALLERLGCRLRHAVGESGAAYRMGGDEFCVLLAATATERAMSAASAALCEHGEGFAISASCGRATIADAATAAEALRTADQRMYRDKRSSRGAAGEQAADALVTVLSERHPEMADHSEGVADHAEAVARWLGVAEESALEIRKGAALHDIGKAAIPDAILSKAGPLDEGEWAFMHRHTLIGERIVSSAPALADVARLVRSSHERWDGGGYPDGLSGDAIPLGARIIFACDAFDAMLAHRPYSAGLDFQAALDELRRCAGTQFDPAVVEAFVAVARQRSTSPLAG